MTTPNDETKPEYVRRVADDGGGGLAPLGDVEDNIEVTFTDLGTIYTSEGTIPSSASIRPAGSFTDANDARKYLEIGGLTGASGGDTIPLGFVYFLQEFDEILFEDIFTVYIDEDTDAP